MSPRFEFRVFGDRLDAERHALERSAETLEEDEPRTDIYFVVPDRVDASLKLRGEGLDLKLLRKRENGLELWEPAAEARFPVAAETLLAGFLGPAGVAVDPGGGTVDRERLLVLARSAPVVRLVRVGKHRRRYRLAGAAAELTRLSVEGLAVSSMAVEDEDRHRVARAVAALGLSGRENTSYQRFLVQTLRTAGPDERGT